jgi:tape measure domain-containing protein
MSDSASFVVRLIDRVTRPSKAITASLGRITKSLDRMQKSKAFGALNSAADRALGWAKTAAVGIAAAGAAIGAITVGMTVNMGRFAEKSRLAFRFLYGGAAAGEEAFQTSIRMSQQLGQDVEGVAGQFVKLRAAQFTLAESQEVFLLAADLKALTGDAEAATRAVTAITQIKAKGRLQAEELVGQLSEAGVSTTLVYDALGARLNKTRDEVRALITAGKIDSDTGIAAIKEAVTKKIGAGKLGDFAKEQAQSTLGGALDRLINAPKLFFLRVAETAKPAMKEIKASVESVIAMLGGFDTAAIGQFVSKVVSLLPVAIDLVRQFSAGFGEGFSEILAGMGSLNGLATDQRQLWFDFGKNVAKGFALAFKIVEGIAQVIQFLQTPIGKVAAGFAILAMVMAKVWLVIQALAPAVAFAEAIIGGIAAALPVIGTILGAIASGIAAVFTAVGAVLGLPAIAVAAIVAAVVAAGVAIYTYWDEIMAFFGSANQWLMEAGGRMIEGLVNGIVAGWQRVRAAVTGVAEGIVGTVKSVLQISSPSKVMEQLGQYTAEGFTLGLQSGDRGSGAFDTEFGSGALAPRGQTSVVQHNRFNVSVTVGAGAKMREVRGAVAEGIRQALDKSGEFSGA